MKFYKMIKKDADNVSIEKEWSFIVCDECEVDIKNRANPKYDFINFFEVKIEGELKNKHLCSGRCLGDFIDGMENKNLKLNIEKKGVNHEN